MNGTVNLKVAEIFRPDLTSSGLLRLDVRAVGTPKSPVLSGEIRLENASVFPAGAPMGIQNANGVIAVSDKRLDIKSFQAELGGGTLTAQGGMQYRPRLHFDLGAKASNVSFLYSGGVRTGFDAELGLTGTTDAALLRGQVTINQLSFTPDFDLASLATGAGVEAPPAPEQGFTSKLKLSIGVQNSSQMNLVSRTLSIRANANLRVTGTAANPVIVGRTNLNGGDLIFMGNRYILQGGTIDFVNPTRTEPVVNVSVGTTIDQYNINMRFQGPVDKLRTAYTSVPALPSVDIINLLAFGKTTEAAQNAPAAPGTLGAESLLASGVASQLSGKIEKIAGISQLSIDPVLGGSQRNPGAHIAVKQRVTSNLFVTFATDLTSAQNQEVLVQYQINRRWSVNANRDQNGGFGFGARVHKNW
jgi:translocation and assembly module TamB